MGAFGGLILTNRGRVLQAKAQTGVRLNFTRIGIGDGQLSGQSILDLNNLISEKKSLSIIKLKTQPGGKAVVGTVLSNQDITTGFYFREIGVFAQDPDVGEILYCYGNAGPNAEYIPAGGGPDIVEKHLDIITIVGNASNVSATIDSSLVFVTQTDFQSHTDATDPHPQYILDAEKGAPGGVAELDGSGLVPLSRIPTNLSSKIAYPTAHKSTHAIGGSDQLTPADIGAIPTSSIGAADGVAELDGSGLIPLLRIPSTLTGKSADMVDNLHASDLAVLGANNQAVNLFQALNQRIDTRSLTMSYDSNGNLTQIVEKDGSTVVKTTTFSYSGGNLTQAQEVIGGKTITTTFSYDGSNNLTGVSRTVA